MTGIPLLITLTSWLFQLELTLALADIFERRGASTLRATPVALAIQHHAQAQGLDPFLVAAVVTVENPLLQSRAKNASGASGIMQVMPGWLKLRPDWTRTCGHNLLNIDTNICIGVRVLRLHLDEHPKSVRKGLLAFNGCRKASCRSYPSIILQRQRQFAAFRPKPRARPI